MWKRANVRCEKSSPGPSANSGMRFKGIKGTHLTVRNERREKKEAAIIKEDFNCFKEGEEASTGI